MSIHSGTGMSTYERILQEARVSGKEIGPKHHLHDKQKQEWAKNNKVDIPKKISSTTANDLKTKTSEAASGAKKATKVAAKVIATIRVQTLPTQDELRERLKKEKMQKLADSLKASDRTEHIKSVGNGL